MILPVLDSPQLVALNSANGKLGPGVVCTYRPVGDTCPVDCPLMFRWDGDVRKPGPCYAKRGRVASVATRSALRTDQLWGAVGAPFVRHLVSGDVMRADSIGRMILDRRYIRHVFAFHKASPRTVGWMYTHASRQFPSALRDECPGNLHLLASVDSIDAARVAQASGWRTARATEDLRDRDRGEFVCPYDAAKKRGRAQKVNCVSCRACWERPDNIVFLKF